MSSLPVSESYSEKGVGYFLLLDELQDTLDKRLDFWRQREISNSSLFIVGKKRKAQKVQMYERIESVALGVSSAMKYLHKQRIVLRDLKPENIGFDSEGTVKLFDFGFARNVDTDFDKYDVAGTYRYMEPQTIIGACSGLPSDVYSYGILLWQTCTLMIPFHEFTDVNLMKENVVKKGLRPRLGAVPSSKLRRLIQACWNSCPNKRPSFDAIYDTLWGLSRWNQTSEQSIEDVSSRSFRKMKLIRLSYSTQ